MAEEIAPGAGAARCGGLLADGEGALRNPMIDHRLAQIAEDGSLKLPQRLFPLLVANAREGRAIARMADVVRAWLDFMATNAVARSRQ